MNTPKFKKGDWIKRKKDGRIARVVMLLKTCYDLRLTDDDCWWLDYDYQDNWELTDAPPKNKLDEAARLYAIPHYMKDIDVNHIEEYPYDSGLEAAFIAGYKYHADHTPLPEDTVLFNKGVAEGKRLMMEEAVEADVNTYRDLAAGKSWAEFVVEMPTNNLGDKVRIIIVKED